MTDELVTLATFTTPTEAGFFRSLLEAEGIPSYLGDDALIGMNPILGNTVGWVKLQVAECDLDRAIDLLESRRNSAAELSAEEFAAESLEERDDDFEPRIPAEPESEPEDVPDDPLEQLATRAFRASVIGFAFFPLLFYSAWLLGRLIFSKGEWSARTSRNAWMAAGLLCTVAGAVWFFFSLHR